MEELIPTQSRSIKSSTWELLAYYHDFVFFSWVKKSLPCYYGNNPEKKKKSSQKPQWKWQDRCYNFVCKQKELNSAP